jgi:hypothetical protein
MPSRSFALGSMSNIALQAVLGTVTVADLVASASGTAQNGYKAPTDFIVINNANGSNTAVTLPEPATLGLTVGDFYELVNNTAQACVVFPPTGGKINNGSANASAAVAASKSVRVYITGTASGSSAFITLTGA